MHIDVYGWDRPISKRIRIKGTCFCNNLLVYRLALVCVCVRVFAIVCKYLIPVNAFRIRNHLAMASAAYCQQHRDDVEWVRDEEERRYRIIYRVHVTYTFSYFFLSFVRFFVVVVSFLFLLAIDCDRSVTCLCMFFVNTLKCSVSSPSMCLCIYGFLSFICFVSLYSICSGVSSLSSAAHLKIEFETLQMQCSFQFQAATWIRRNHTVT